MGFLLLFLALTVIVGTIVAQVYLSLKESKWPGLILPLFTLCLSLAVFFRTLIFTGAANTGQTMPGPSMETATDYVRAAFLFLYCNIPTTLLLAVYAACGGRRKRLGEANRITGYDYDEF